MAVGRRTTDDGRTDDASKGGVPIGCQWVVRIGWPAMAVGGSTVSAVVRSSLFLEVGVIERDPQQMARVPCDQVASICAAFGIFFLFVDCTPC